MPFVGHEVEELVPCPFQIQVLARHPVSVGKQRQFGGQHQQEPLFKVKSVACVLHVCVCVCVSREGKSVRPALGS